MKHHFNLAFVPLTAGKDFISLSEKFASIASGYLLGQQSIPHVTVCQFIGDENKAGVVWDQAQRVIIEKEILLTFNRFSVVKVDGGFAVSLLPVETGILKSIFETIIPFVPEPVPLTLGFYDPHLTLVVTEEEDLGKWMDGVSLAGVSDTFGLVLGAGDENGQLVRILNF